MKNYNTESDGNIAQSRRLSAILPLTPGRVLYFHCYTDKILTKYQI